MSQLARTTRDAGFHLDLNLCTGCSACELACSIENELAWGHSWRRVISFNAERLPAIPSYHLSLACNHCAEAPCVRACPARAIDRNPETGAVLIEPDHCIGCGYCAWACPYEAPQFDGRAGVMRKCTWCDHRLADGLEPACVEQCPTAALTFRPLKGAALVPGFPETPAQPAIRFEPLAEGRQRGPESSWEVPREVVESFAAARPPEEPRISLRSEWPLLIFSLLASALVGWILASVGRAEPPGLIVLLGLAALAAGASTLHLGKKARAWRAVLNLRHSWLSREIVSFSAFVLTAAAYSAGVGPPALGFVAGGLGLLALVSIDRVYDFVRTPAARPVHSADTLLTGLLVGVLVLGEGLLALTVLAVKLALYASRHMRRHDLASGGPGWSMPAVRILLGFVLPPLLVQLAPAMLPAWAWACIGIAEIVDRAEFYNELEVWTPRRQVDLDLRQMRREAAEKRVEPALSLGVGPFLRRSTSLSCGARTNPGAAGFARDQQGPAVAGTWLRRVVAEDAPNALSLCRARATSVPRTWGGKMGQDTPVDAASVAGGNTPVSFGIGIPCHNEAQNIESLLTRLCSATDAILPEKILVVSSASTDGTDEIVRAFARYSKIPVALKSEPERRGKGAAVNELIRELSHVEVIVMISGDVMPEEGFLEPLLAAFGDPGVGVAGGRPIVEGPVENWACRVARLLWDLHHEIARKVPKTTEVTAFRNIGTFIDDNTLVDEAELECALTGAGYEVRYLPEVLIHSNAPLSLRDYVTQRTRVTVGHMILAADSGYRMGTLSLRQRASAIRELWRRGKLPVATLLLAAGLEAFIYMRALLELSSARARHGVWRSIESTKRPFVSGS